MIKKYNKEMKFITSRTFTHNTIEELKHELKIVKHTVDYWFSKFKTLVDSVIGSVSLRTEHLVRLMMAISLMKSGEISILRMVGWKCQSLDVFVIQMA